MKAVKLFLILIGLTLSSCVGDDKPQTAPITIPQANGFEVNGQQKHSKRAYITYKPSSLNRLIVITDGEILSNPVFAPSLNSNSFSAETTNEVVFNLNAPTSNSIVGTYIFANGDFENTPGKMQWCSLMTGITVVDNQINGYGYEASFNTLTTDPISSGSLTILKVGANYRFQYVFNREGGRSISGYFSGALTELEYAE